MGLPQMIQSRAQFGLKGAIVPFAAVVFVYIGFNVFNVILATDAINTVLPGQRAPGTWASSPLPWCWRWWVTTCCTRFNAG